MKPYPVNRVSSPIDETGSVVALPGTNGRLVRPSKYR
jgi:hypothetical protein